MRGLIVSRFQVQKSQNSVNEHLGIWNGVLNISGFQVPRCQNQGGLQTLAPRAASYYILIPSPKTTKRTLGPGTVSSYIEVQNLQKRGGRTLGPGTLSCYIEVSKYPR
jgi:hypothetical protein